MANSSPIEDYHFRLEDFFLMRCLLVIYCYTVMCSAMRKLLFAVSADSIGGIWTLINKEEEKLNHFDGQFVKSAIADFVSSNKLPLVTFFTRESAPSVFENPIKKQLLLFATSNDSEKVIPIFQEAAKSFKGKLIFVFVDLDNEDAGKPVADYFGITGSAPQVLQSLSAIADHDPDNVVALTPAKRNIDDSCSIDLMSPQNLSAKFSSTAKPLKIKAEKP